MSQHTVAASGLSEVDIDLIQAEVNSMPHHSWSFVDGPRASVLIVDIDTVWGHMEWLRATASGQQVAALSTDKKVRGCELMLHKPLRAAQVRELLQQVAPSDAPQPDARANASAPESAALDLDIPESASDTEPAPAAAVTERDVPAPPAQEPAQATQQTESAPPEPETMSAATQPAPADMTLGEALLAGMVSEPLAIKGLGGVELLLDPERGGYTGSNTLKPLAPLLERTLTETRTLDADAVEQMRKAPALPLTRLLWFAALSATPGQLAPNLDPQARYHLGRWPQIEREFPRHFRIATAMMKAPGSLGDIASLANAPMTDVVDFVNAYTVAGYVTNDARPTNDARAVDANRGKRFARLRRSFARSGQDPA